MSTNAYRPCEAVSLNHPCPLCMHGAGYIFYRANAPLFASLPKGRSLAQEKVALLELVHCEKCGHAYNHLFENSLADQIYRFQGLTNVPVDPSMYARYNDLVDWLGISAIKHKNVIEIGAGAGALARLIAKTANKVTLFEPSLALHPEMLPEDNIELINENWSANEGGGKADLIICRQMLEHMSNPVEIMREIRSELNDGGLAYLEVPSAEYIYDHFAYTDIHVQHVQYFTRSHFLGAAASVGLREVRSLNIKDGHDFGVLFCSAETGLYDETLNPSLGILRKQLTAKQESADLVMSKTPTPIIFFGATLHTQTFLNALSVPLDILAVVDDNPENCTREMFFQDEILNVVSPTKQILSQAGSIVIGAYLHDIAISRKICGTGFTGQLYTVHPHQLEAGSNGMLSSYSG